MIKLALISTLIDIALNVTFGAIDRTLTPITTMDAPVHVGDVYSVIMVYDNNMLQYFYECHIEYISGPVISFRHYNKCTTTFNGITKTVDCGYRTNSLVYEMEFIA